MFYEEQVRNGVLCYRSTPTGEWVPMSAERLTAMLLELRQRPAPAQMQPAPHYTVMPQPTFLPAAPMWHPWHPPYTITCGARGGDIPMEAWSAARIGFGRQ